MAGKTDIAIRMAEERLRLGLTQDALATKAGMSRLSILNYENGATIPSGEALIAFHEAGIDIRYVLVGMRDDRKAMRQLFLQAYVEVKRQAELNQETLCDDEQLDLSWRIFDALDSVSR